jgi:hypothetical protein
LASLSNHFFILAYLSNFFSHIFFPIFCHLFSSLPYEHATRGFVFYKYQQIKMTLDELEIILVYYYKLEMCLVV